MLAVIAASAPLVATPLLAAISAPPGVPVPLSDTEFRALIGPAMQAAQAQDCPKLFGMVDPVLSRLSGRNRNAVQLLRLPCLSAAGRGQDVADTYKELADSDPQNPLIRSVGVVMSVSDGQFVEAGTRLASLAEDDPTALARINGVLARNITQALSEQKAFEVRDRLFIALAHADWRPRDMPDMRDGLTQGAIEALLSAKRVGEAQLLLERIEAPDLLAGMAAERHYQSLWPAIEKRLGAHAAVASDRYAAARIDAFANQPNDETVRRNAARALLFLGRNGEAAEVGATVVISNDMKEEDVATVRYGAQALAAQGQIDQAVTRFKALAALDFTRVPAAAASLVVLAELLNEHGRNEDALLAARAPAGQSGALSGWGTSWLKRSEACALADLGRTAEANRVGDSLKASSELNPAASIEGLLCLRRSNDAAAIATATLATTEGAGMLVDQFQPKEALWAPTGSRLRALWATFRQRSDVAAAFAKVARILPEQYWPSRDPRPIPRIIRRDDVPVA